MPVAAVDEWEVRYQAARRAAVMAGVVSVPFDDPWWTRWHKAGPSLDPLDFEGQALRYEQAVERLGASALYERHLVQVRRNAELNAARGVPSLGARIRAHQDATRGASREVMAPAARRASVPSTTIHDTEE